MFRDPAGSSSLRSIRPRKACSSSSKSQRNPGRLPAFEVAVGPANPASRDQASRRGSRSRQGNESSQHVADVRGLPRRDRQRRSARRGVTPKVAAGWTFTRVGAARSCARVKCPSAPAEVVCTVSVSATAQIACGGHPFGQQMAGDGSGVLHLVDDQAAGRLEHALCQVAGVDDRARRVEVDRELHGAARRDVESS